MNRQQIVKQFHGDVVHYRDALRELRDQVKRHGKERVLALQEGREADARKFAKSTADSLRDCVLLEEKLREAADSLADALQLSDTASS